MNRVGANQIRLLARTKFITRFIRSGHSLNGMRSMRRRSSRLGGNRPASVESQEAVANWIARSLRETTQ